MEREDCVFVVTVRDLQDEAIERIGRELTEEEIDIAIDGFDWGFRAGALDITYNTIFTEMIEK